jgi:hypothetical protein
MNTRSIVIALGALAFACAPVAHGQNLILNGSFEDNTANVTMFNMSNAEFNAIVANATAFGDAEEIDLILGTGGFGLAPIDGDWKLAIHRQAGGATDAFSFDLMNSIVAGTTYRLEFWAHAVTDFDPGTEPVQIGISTSATSFGTLVFATGQLSVGSWTQYIADFTAPINADYLTVQNAPGTQTWAHIDAFSLTVVPAPSAFAMLALGGIFGRTRRRTR